MESENICNLYKYRLSSTGEHQIEGMKLAVEQVEDYQEEGLIGGEFWTHLALKNKTSFMIGTYTKGLKLIENGKPLYSGKLPFGGGWLGDIIYIEHLDCYFIDHNHQLYKKGIDDKPPKLFMDLICSLTVGASFAFSRRHKKLVVNKDYEIISVINLENEKVEIEAHKQVGEKIKQFILFGEAKDRVISTTVDGYIILYRLDYNQKTGSVTSESQVELMKERKESPLSLAICTDGQYIFLEIGRNERPYFCSRMIIFKLKEDTLIKKACIDHYQKMIGHKFALECLGYFGRQIIWLGLGGDKNGVAQVYGYDTVTGAFEEHEDKRVSHHEKHVVKIHRMEEKFYFIGGFGTIKQLSITF